MNDKKIEAVVNSICTSMKKRHNDLLLDSIEINKMAKDEYNRGYQDGLKKAIEMGLIAELDDPPITWIEVMQKLVNSNKKAMRLVLYIVSKTDNQVIYKKCCNLLYINSYINMGLGRFVLKK